MTPEDISRAFSKDLQDLPTPDASTDTTTGETYFLAPAPQLVGHVDHLTGAGATHRMAERDAAAPLVRTVPRKLREIVER